MRTDWSVTIITRGPQWGVQCLRADWSVTIIARGPQWGVQCLRADWLVTIITRGPQWGVQCLRADWSVTIITWGTQWCLLFLNCYTYLTKRWHCRSLVITEGLHHQNETFLLSFSNLISTNLIGFVRHRTVTVGGILNK